MPDARQLIAALLEDDSSAADAFDFNAPSSPVLPSWVKTADQAFEYANDRRWKEQHSTDKPFRCPEIEPLVLKRAKDAGTYAYLFLKGRWPEAEAKILRSPEDAFFYARDVMRKRWPEAEPVIRAHKDTWSAYCRDFGLTESTESDFDFSAPSDPVLPSKVRTPYDAFRYAFYQHVNHGRTRVPEAEPLMLTDPDAACLYAINISQQRWPEAESVIASSPQRAYGYARNVLNRRWPEVESTIRQDSKWWKLYCAWFSITESTEPDFDFDAPSAPVLPNSVRTGEEAYRYALDQRLVHGRKRVPEAEPMLLSDLSATVYTFLYIEDVLRRRWPKAEKKLKQNPYVWTSYCANYNVNESTDDQIPDLDVDPLHVPAQPTWQDVCVRDGFVYKDATGLYVRCSTLEDFPRVTIRHYSIPGGDRLHVRTWDEEAVVVYDHTVPADDIDQLNDSIAVAIVKADGLHVYADEEAYEEVDGDQGDEELLDESDIPDLDADALHCPPDWQSVLSDEQFFQVSGYHGVRAYGPMRRAHAVAKEVSGSLLMYATNDSDDVMREGYFKLSDLDGIRAYARYLRNMVNRLPTRYGESEEIPDLDVDAMHVPELATWQAVCRDIGMVQRGDGAWATAVFHAFPRVQIVPTQSNDTLKVYAIDGDHCVKYSSVIPMGNPAQVRSEILSAKRAVNIHGLSESEEIPDLDMDALACPQDWREVCREEGLTKPLQIGTPDGSDSMLLQKGSRYVHVIRYSAGNIDVIGSFKREKTCWIRDLSSGEPDTLRRAIQQAKISAGLLRKVKEAEEIPDLDVDPLYDPGETWEDVCLSEGMKYKIVSVRSIVSRYEIDSDQMGTYLSVCLWQDGSLSLNAVVQGHAMPESVYGMRQTETDRLRDLIRVCKREYRFGEQPVAESEQIPDLDVDMVSETEQPWEQAIKLLGFKLMGVANGIGPVYAWDLVPGKSVPFIEVCPDPAHIGELQVIAYAEYSYAKVEAAEKISVPSDDLKEVVYAIRLAELGVRSRLPELFSNEPPVMMESEEIPDLDADLTVPTPPRTWQEVCTDAGLKHTVGQEYGSRFDTGYRPPCVVAFKYPPDDRSIKVNLLKSFTVVEPIAVVPDTDLQALAKAIADGKAMIGLTESEIPDLEFDPLHEPDTRTWKQVLADMFFTNEATWSDSTFSRPIGKSDGEVVVDYRSPEWSGEAGEPELSVYAFGNEGRQLGAYEKVKAHNIAAFKEALEKAISTVHADCG